MSKIEQIMPADPSGQIQSQPKANQESGEPRSAEVLQKVAGGQEFNQQEAQAALEAEELAAAESQKVQEIQALDQVLSPKQINGLVRAEKTLEILSDYERQLGDDSVSLKEMAGTVENLEEQVKKLTEALQGLDSDDELKGLMQNVATTAMVETIKFKRGDYISA